MTEETSDDGVSTDDDGSTDAEDDRGDSTAAIDDDEPVEPDVPSGRDVSKGGKVLTPDELDISRSEYVVELDDKGRFVVSPGGGPPTVTRSAAEDDSEAAGLDRRKAPDDGEESRPSGGPGSPEAARSLLADELGRANARYGIDVIGRINGETVRHRTVSNDVVATFEGLVQWYAQHVAVDTPADEVIDILLSEADLTGPSTESLAQLLEDHDLDRSDTIEELIEAIDAEARSLR